MNDQNAIWLKDYIDQAQAKLTNAFNEALNRQAGHNRKRHEEHEHRLSQGLTDLGHLARGLQMRRSGGSGDGFTWYNAAGIARIEDIPGRRQPFDLTVDINIGGGAQSSTLQNSVTISQEGPFVAVSRFATFMSLHQFQVTVDQQRATFSGRSYGRFRPVHSAWDLLDGQSNSIVSTTNPPTLGALPGAAELPSSMSGFRTMELDGRITVINAGSQFPYQQEPLPSSFWSHAINEPFGLGALGFFERGETLTFGIQPSHENNPPAGNANGDNIFGVAGGWPFLAGQFDKHEGIVTPDAFTVATVGGVNVVTPITTDPVVRLPNGILTIGFHGYRILQPVGPVQ